MTQTIRNCTPHTLNIHTPDGQVELSPAGPLPRVATITDEAPPINGIPVVASRLGAVEGLPDPEPNTVLVVSRLVAGARPDRTDLVFPGELIRDDQGRPIGCRGLARLGG